MNDILKTVKNNFPEIVNYRRSIHKNPELSFQEYETSKYIKSILTELGIEYQSILETGVVATIGNGEKCIALRADIDALPIQEETKLTFASKNKGVMHACGHDFHSAMLLGAAKVLKQYEAKLKVQVKLIFQPGEEKLPGGALQMIKAGVLENPIPSAIFGQHVNPEIETGSIALAPGYVMASADELYWTINGKGGHAAQPHLNDDTIISSSQLVLSLQSLMTKFKNPLDSGVLSITSIHGGSAPNIFPDEVKLMGTLRTFNNEWRNFIHKKIDNISQKVCDLYNTKCELTIKKGYPPLFNNESSSDFVKEIANNIFDSNKILDFEPKMWAEDFAYYSEIIPSTFWFLGINPKNHTTMPPLHNAKLSPDEEALIYGTAMFVEIAINYHS